MKKIIFLFLAFACFKISSAQKLSSTLLWRISGNGLQKPSYLFGTMHLTDDRVFNIGDSVYNAIEKSDGFAIEIDPSEFTPLVIDEAKKSIEETKRLKDVMDKDAFNKYGKALAKKLNKKEDDITTEDVLREKNKWIQESYTTGKMPIFLDVYLFDVARKQGKWTGGVEDLKDQEGFIDDLVDESDVEQLAVDNDGAKNRNQSNNELEKFILTYTKADLNAIDSITTNNQDSLTNDEVIVKRNRKMAMRMDSLSKIRSMVFAVGAAHLPGNKGLIALLREKGFAVEPVFSTKKIKPGDYKITEVAQPWYNIKDEEGLYEDSLPGKPGNLTLYGFLNMKIYFDVFTSTVYMTMGLKTPYSQHMADSVFQNISDYYFGIGSYKKGKPIVLNDVPGKEFSSKNNYTHGYLLFNNGMMYLAIGTTTRKDTVGINSINRFLQSFKIFENNNKSSNEAYVYTNSKMGYKVDLPTQPKKYDDMSLSKDSSIVREVYFSSDMQNGSYFFVGTNQAAKGYFLNNDSSILASIRQAQLEKYSVINVDTLYKKNNHWVLELSGLSVQSSLGMRTYYETRGNKWYALVAIYDSTKSHSSVDNFFNSFSMLDYPIQEWKEAENSMFSTWAPDVFRYTEKSTGTKNDTLRKHECYDSLRGDSYDVIVRSFPEYYWQNSDSAIWKNIIDNRIGETDILISKKIIKNGDAEGYELLMQEENSNNIKRERIFLNDNNSYSLVTVQAATEINNDNNNKFFANFRFNNLKSNTGLRTSKAAILLNDISSADSLVRRKAKNYLSSANFSKEELSLLYNALLKNYKDDEMDETYTKEKLKNIIIDLNDTSSYSFAKQQYALANDTLKSLLLEIMVSFKTTKSYDDIKNILLKQPPRIKFDYAFINKFTDSLALTSNIFPQLIPLLNDTSMAPFIIRVAEKLIDSNLVNITLLKPYQQNILQFAQTQNERIKNNPDDFDYSVYSLIPILGKMNNAECNTMLQNFSLVKQPYIQLETLGELLKNNQTINTSAIQQLAAKKESRTDLYDTLKAYKKENLFPKQYFTQKYFAESYVYTAASDDDEPSEITYITQKLINFKGRQSRFFFYKVSYDEDDEKNYSLACAGPFDANTAKVADENADADIYSDEDFDQEKLTLQTDALIQQMEGWYEWKENKK